MANPTVVQLQQHRFERLLMNQMIARRLRVEQPAQLEILQLAYEDLFEAAMSISGANFLRVVSEWLTLFEYEAARSLMKSGDFQKLRDKFAIDTTELDEDRLIVQALIPHVESLNNFQRDFNYLDYSNLFGLLSYCPAEKLVEDFDKKSKNNWIPSSTERDARHLLPHDRASEDIDRPEFRWFRNGRDRPPEVHVAMMAAISQPRFNSPGIKVVHSLQQKHLLGTDNVLALLVDLNHIPVDIDEAVRYFRVVLHERLSQQIWVDEVQSDLISYMKTDFVGAGFKGRDLFSQTSELLTTLVALWCWDLNTLEKKSITFAYDKVGAQRSSWKTNTGDFEVFKRHHRKVKALISPRAGCSKLDDAFTGKRGLALGRRQGPAI